MTEAAFEDDEIVAELPDEGEPDHNFIEELDNSMSEEIRRDQLKG